MMPLRRRPDAAAGLQVALVVREFMRVVVLVLDGGSCQVRLHGARESSRAGATFAARGTVVAVRSRNRRGSIAYFRTL